MKSWVLAASLIMMCCVGVRPLAAQQVDFVFDDTLKAGDVDLPYTLNLGLSAADATRVGVNALLDLSETQNIVSERLADNALVDNCGVQVKLDDLSILAKDDAIALDSLLKITRFDCGRISQQDFRRGDELGKFSANLAAVVSVELRDNCAYLKMPDLDLSSAGATSDQLLQENTLAEVKSFLLAAIDLVLNETPLCPKLPDELASLDPSYDTGGPREIGDGGLGVLLSGSIDVSPTTIIDVLLVLQQKGKIPTAP